MRALRELCAALAKDIVRGGEGATRLVEVQVAGAQSDADARRTARLIANSLLVKTALHGGDPNWGRLLAVAGRAGVAFDEARARVRIGPAELFADATVFDEREAEAAAHLRASEVEVAVDLGTGGGGAATVWTCDLSAEYVRIKRRLPDMTKPLDEDRAPAARPRAPRAPRAPPDTARAAAGGASPRARDAAADRPDTARAAAGGASPRARDAAADRPDTARARGSLEGRCYLSVLDFQPDDLEHNLALAASLKRDRRLGREAATAAALEGTYLALLFEKPSLRTRSTFEIAIRELGGDFIDPDADVALGKRESLADVGRSLERWVAGAVVRTYAQSRLTELALATTGFRVINALSDEEHPCQALADCLTLKERWGDTQGRRVAFVGDGGNVATSFAQAAAMLGITVHIASPEGFELPESVDRDVARVARGGAELRRFHDPAAAVREVDAVYTDVWTSMGREAEVALRRRLFGAYQVNDALMAHARPDACFLHCLPAHRGEEVTDSVMDGTASVVFDQAENRLHTQKALLLMLFED